LAFSLMWCSRSSAAALSPIATVALPVACATWPTSSLRVAAYAAAPAATSPANGPTNASPTTPPATAAPPSTLLLVVAAAASCEFVCRCESGGGGGGGRFIFTLPSLHQRRTLLSSRRGMLAIFKDEQNESECDIRSLDPRPSTKPVWCVVYSHDEHTKRGLKMDGRSSPFHHSARFGDASLPVRDRPPCTPTRRLDVDRPQRI
jgi:hypothetical protein